MRVRYDEDIGEKAYLIWKECGHNARKTARLLAEEGLHIHRNTIALWRDRCGWKMRAVREQKDEGMVNEMSDTGLVEGLEAQKKRYEGFFETLGPQAIDVQATYAYTTLVKAIADVHRKMAFDLYTATPEVMEPFVKFIKARAETLGKPLVQQVFDLIDKFFDEVKPE